MRLETLASGKVPMERAAVRPWLNPARKWLSQWTLWHPETLPIRDKTHSLQARLGNPKAEALEQAVLQVVPTLVDTFQGACLPMC